jgi:energy-coupling factor transporter ATP-binding protein EcfA2
VTDPAPSRPPPAVLKLIYTGPRGSGKTTNLQGLQGLIAPESRGRLTVLDAPRRRPLYFELLPVLAAIGDVPLRVRVFAAPSGRRLAAARRAVMRGADAVVFVADAAPGRAADNASAHRDLIDDLGHLAPDGLPVVVQHNKRDLADAVPVAPGGPAGEEGGVVEAVATRGVGVRETFLAAVAAATARRGRAGLAGLDPGRVNAALERIVREPASQGPW